MSKTLLPSAPNASDAEQFSRLVTFPLVDASRWLNAADRIVESEDEYASVLAAIDDQVPEVARSKWVPNTLSAICQSHVNAVKVLRDRVQALRSALALTRSDAVSSDSSATAQVPVDMTTLCGDLDGLLSIGTAEITTSEQQQRPVLSFQHAYFLYTLHFPNCMARVRQARTRRNRVLDETERRIADALKARDIDVCESEGCLPLETLLFMPVHRLPMLVGLLKELEQSAPRSCLDAASLKATIVRFKTAARDIHQLLGHIKLDQPMLETDVIALEQKWMDVHHVSRRHGTGSIVSAQSIESSHSGMSTTSVISLSAPEDAMDGGGNEPMLKVSNAPQPGNEASHVTRTAQLTNWQRHDSAETGARTADDVQSPQRATSSSSTIELSASASPSAVSRSKLTRSSKKGQDNAKRSSSSGKTGRRQLSGSARDSNLIGRPANFQHVIHLERDHALLFGAPTASAREAIATATAPTSGSVRVDENSKVGAGRRRSLPDNKHHQLKTTAQQPDSEATRRPGSLHLEPSLSSSPGHNNSIASKPSSIFQRRSTIDLAETNTSGRRAMAALTPTSTSERKTRSFKGLSGVFRRSTSKPFKARLEVSQPYDFEHVAHLSDEDESPSSQSLTPTDSQNSLSMQQSTVTVPMPGSGNATLPSAQWHPTQQDECDARSTTEKDSDRNHALPPSFAADALPHISQAASADDTYVRDAPQQTKWKDEVPKLRRSSPVIARNSRLWRQSRDSYALAQTEGQVEPPTLSSLSRSPRARSEGVEEEHV